MSNFLKLEVTKENLKQALDDDAMIILCPALDRESSRQVRNYFRQRFEL